MNDLRLETYAQKFFDEFVEAFCTFDGTAIGELYLVPYLAFHTHRSADVFLSSADTAAYFQCMVNGYRAKGCRSCRYYGLGVIPLGQECALATVSWELLAEDLSILVAWRESYNLCLVEDRFHVFASTDHSP